MIVYIKGVCQDDNSKREELNKIYDLSNSRDFEFLVMYGRRRVGKTELLKELLRNEEL